ncbi:unnamed protein product [Parnassius apollo]|uniref:(apollo) hypothetical protein n=1 Tax=Parnassius apollo TaxID=110799 RepID=A0A8S3WFR2_PARAO|nr:unnamed protein product [Parnassius apollo]
MIVTAANTRLISQAVEEIRTATRSLLSIKSVVSSSPPTSNSELKDEILACVREEIASVKNLSQPTSPLTHKQQHRITGLLHLLGQPSSAAPHQRLNRQS